MKNEQIYAKIKNTPQILSELKAEGLINQNCNGEINFLSSNGESEDCRKIHEIINRHLSKRR